jgi:hypothetical protein
VLADLLAWFPFVGVTVSALVVTALGTVHTYRNMQAAGKSEETSTALTAAAAVVWFLSGWLFLGLYWLVARTLRTVSRVHAE